MYKKGGGTTSAALLVCPLFALAKRLKGIHKSIYGSTKRANAAGEFFSRASLSNRRVCLTRFNKSSGVGSLSLAGAFDDFLRVDQLPLALEVPHPDGRKRRDGFGR